MNRISSIIFFKNQNQNQRKIKTPKILYVTVLSTTSVSIKLSAITLGEIYTATSSPDNLIGSSSNDTIIMNNLTPDRDYTFTVTASKERIFSNQSNNSISCRTIINGFTITSKIFGVSSEPDNFFLQDSNLNIIPISSAKYNQTYTLYSETDQQAYAIWNECGLDISIGIKINMIGTIIEPSTHNFWETLDSQPSINYLIPFQTSDGLNTTFYIYGLDNNNTILHLPDEIYMTINVYFPKKIYLSQTSVGFNTSDSFLFFKTNTNNLLTIDKLIYGQEYYITSGNGNNVDQYFVRVLQNNNDGYFGVMLNKYDIYNNTQIYSFTIRRFSSGLRVIWNIPFIFTGSPLSFYFYGLNRENTIPTNTETMYMKLNIY